MNHAHEQHASDSSSKGLIVRHLFPEKVPSHFQWTFPLPNTLTDDAAKSASVPAPEETLSFSRDCLSRQSRDARSSFWTGSQAEDLLTEQVINSGFADKQPAFLAAETSTARPNVWPILRANTGLPVLATLFSQVISQRRRRRRCIAPTSFRAPPRVTLTDSKRELWLRDLASNAVPLRRLSRTIPHGIRGKILLEQCLAKSVPLNRVLWLAKCVGANEIRASRRKGLNIDVSAATASDWLLEWTLAVEGFAQDTLGSLESPDTRRRNQYLVRLLTTLFANRLLDTTHYLLWLLDGLAQSSDTDNSIWLVLANIHSTDLCARRTLAQRFGRLLSDLVSPCTPFTTRSINVCKSLAVRLMLKLVVAHAEIFVGFNHSASCAGNLRGQSLDPVQSKAIRDIGRRTDLLHRPNLSPSSFEDDQVMSLYDCLDACTIDPSLDSLTAAFQTRQTDGSIKLRALVMWSTTIYRSSKTRPYLACALLGRIHARDARDVNYIYDIILSRLAAPDTIQDMLVQLLKLLCLARVFNLALFLQRLVACGAYIDATATSVQARLLYEMPVECWSDASLALRTLLLRRIEPNNHLIGPTVERKLKLKMLAILEPEHDSFTGCRLLQRLSDSDWASIDNCNGHVRNDLAQDIRLKLASMICISPQQFVNARAMLTRLGDLEGLAKIISQGCATANPELLAGIADTLCIEFRFFIATCRFRIMCDAVAERYRTLRQVQPVEQRLLGPLLGLAHQARDRDLEILLQSDLITAEEKHAVLVCSPASESAILDDIDTIMTSKDLDHILASGTIMSRDSMSRIVEYVDRYACGHGVSSSETIQQAGLWYSKLRTFDPVAFDGLVLLQLESVLSNGSSDLYPSVIALVGSGCIRLELIARHCQKQPGLQAKYLACCVPRDHHVCDTEVSYRFMLAQRRFCDEHAPEVTSTICDLVSTSGLSVNTLMINGLPQLIKHYVSIDIDMLLAAFSDAILRHGPSKIPRLQLMIGACAPSSSKTDWTDADDIFSTFTGLSVRYALVALRLICISVEMRVDIVEGTRLIDAFMKLSSKDDLPWNRLVPALTKAMNEKVSAAVFEQLARLYHDGSPHATLALEIPRSLRLLSLTSSSDEDSRARLACITDIFLELGGKVRLASHTHVKLVASEFYWLEVYAQVAAYYVSRVQLDDSTTHALSSLLMVCCEVFAATTSLSDTSKPVLVLIFDLASFVASRLSTKQNWHVFETLRHETQLLGAVRYLTDQYPLDHDGLASISLVAEIPDGKASAIASGHKGLEGLSTLSEAKDTIDDQSVGGTTVFRAWEMVSDAAPEMTENDACLNLTLFAARKVA